MMPKAKSNADVIAMRKEAVNTLTSTTNWSDRFINADEFPDVIAAEKNKYTLPPVPTLNASQRKMVGWDD